MILEQAVLHIIAGQEGAFESAFEHAQVALVGAAGYLAHELQRSLENPQRYALLVEWETLEQHAMNFRDSVAYQQWRLIFGPFLAKPPQVEHFRLVAGRGVSPALLRTYYQD